MLRLWILKILDGLFTLLGEILIFFGVYSFLSSRELGLVGIGLFFLVLGQFAGINAMKYENRKKLTFFYLNVMENIGQQFAYPVLVFVLYLMNKNQLFLVLAFALTLIAMIKASVIAYKAKIAETLLTD